MATFTISQTPDAKNVFLYPESNGCVNSCSPIGDIPNWRCTDDTYNALEPETTYVWMDGASTVSELYTMENHGTITGTINYVKACDKAKNYEYPPHINATYKVVISNDRCADYACSGNMPLCTGYGLFEYAWLENPWTSVDWTWGDIDDLQAGFECSSPAVLMSPFAILPTDDGDRIDITSVTTGYDHWKAVAQDKPYAEVFESGAAWKYDLYKYIKAANYGTQTRGILYHNGYVFSANMADGAWIHKWNGEQLEYVTNQDDGGSAQGWTTDGTYYYLANATEIIAYTFDGESLTLVARANTTTLNQTIHIIYNNGYIYLGDGSNIEAWSFNGVTLTEIDTASVGANVEGIYHDETYLYVTTSGGKIFAFSFDGSTFTELDQDQQALDRGENFERVSGDGTYIYACAVMDGVYAYSFDGTTLTYITRKDDGGSYYGVEAYSGYIFCTVEAAQDQLRAYTFNGAVFTAVGTNYDMPGGHIMWDITAYADGYLFTTYPNAEMYVFSGSIFSKIADVEDDNTPKYLTDNIISVTVVAKMGKDHTAPDGADIRGCFNIKTHATEYNTSTSYLTLESVQRYYAHTWTTNPNTSAAWTLAEVKALQAGIGLYGTGTKYATCSRCYVVIGASTSVSPEIHTCQTHLKVNYTPPKSTCTLNKPQEISTNHTRNIKLLNFWDGEREVYDLNRSGKSMVLIGSEAYTDSCDRILCIREMARNGTVVEVAGLPLGYFNGNYRIMSFGWKKIGEKPEHYKWIIELEDTEL